MEEKSSKSLLLDTLFDKLRKEATSLTYGSPDSSTPFVAYRDFLMMVNVSLSKDEINRIIDMKPGAKTLEDALTPQFVFDLAYERLKVLSDRRKTEQSRSDPSLSRSYKSAKDGNKTS